nr:hypothetical protein [Candidatus Sigynarchaeota archaeon]
MTPADHDRVFFSPVLQPANIEACSICNACKHACPVHAISISTTGAEVDRVACMNSTEKNKGGCFDCLLACKYGILSLRRFKRRIDGNIVETM